MEAGGIQLRKTAQDRLITSEGPIALLPRPRRGRRASAIRARADSSQSRMSIVTTMRTAERTSRWATGSPAHLCGVDNYLQVITAQTATLANQRTEIDILRRRMDASVLLSRGMDPGASPVTGDEPR
jgi:hypothetical protein